MTRLVLIWVTFGIFLVLLMIVFYSLVLQRKGMRRGIGGIDEGLEMQRKSMELSREYSERSKKGLQIAEDGLALQKETNRLLERLISIVTKNNLTN